MASLSTILTYASKKLGWISKNPCLSLMKLKESSGRDRVLSPEEIRKLVEACRESKSSYLYPVVLISLSRSYFDRDIWSLQSFCALMGGLSPDRFKQISESKGEGFAELDIKRALSANKIQKRFLRDFEEIYSMEKPSLVSGDFYMTPWKFIKWVSMNDIRLLSKLNF